MKLAGSYTFDAPRDVVWQALLDPEVLANVMPGCEKLEQVGDNEYEGVIKIKVGPVQGQFQGKVTLANINKPDSYSMTIDGKGAPGFMKGEGHVTLEMQGNTTLMRYTGEAQVGGRIASVGQRLLDSSAKALTKQSLDGLDRQIQARLQSGAAQPEGATNGAVQAQPSAPAAQAPSEVEFALGIAKNMLQDLIPPERRPILIAAGLGVIAFLLFLHWWANVVARRVADEIWERR